MLGVGDMDLKLEGHFDVSDSTREWTLAEDIGRSRRAIAWIVGLTERDVRVVRIWEPYGIDRMKREIKVMHRILTTSPVHPTSAADVILSAMDGSFLPIDEPAWIYRESDMDPELRLSEI